MLLDELEARPWLAVRRFEALHREHRGERNYTRTVAEAVASGSPDLERGGGWLLRRVLAERGDCPPEDWRVVVDGLPGVRSWAGRLLLCQLLSGHPVLMDSEPAAMAEFLRGCCSDPKPTVRAWGVNAFHELGRRNGKFRAEAGRLVAIARRDSAKCVQARLRHLT